MKGTNYLIVLVLIIVALFTGCSAGGGVGTAPKIISVEIYDSGSFTESGSPLTTLHLNRGVLQLTFL